MSASIISLRLKDINEGIKRCGKKILDAETVESKILAREDKYWIKIVGL